MKKPSKPHSSKTHNTPPPPNISYIKTGASIDIYILRTEWSAHSLSRVLLHPVARHAKWETNTEWFCTWHLKMRLNKDSYLRSLTVPSASSVQKGFSLFGWNSVLFYFFLITLITTIWSDKSFPQGLFQNHDNVLVSSLRKKETNMCVCICECISWLELCKLGGKEQDVVIVEKMNTES